MGVMVSSAVFSSAWSLLLSSFLGGCASSDVHVLGLSQEGIQSQGCLEEGRSRTLKFQIFEMRAVTTVIIIHYYTSRYRMKTINVKL